MRPAKQEGKHLGLLSDGWQDDTKLDVLVYHKSKCGRGAASFFAAERSRVKAPESTEVYCQIYFIIFFMLSYSLSISFARDYGTNEIYEKVD